MREKLPDKRNNYIRSCLMRQSRLTSNEVNAYFDRSKHVDRLEVSAHFVRSKTTLLKIFMTCLADADDWQDVVMQ